MYAEVVVLTYQSPEIQTYTYEIPKELEEKIKVGQLVSVPFGKRNPTGVVISIRATVSEGIRGIREIGEILMKEPLMLPYQVDLLKWMSAYYHAPMVNCLKAMLPELPSKLLMVNSKWKDSTNFSKTIHHSIFTIHQTLVLVPSINRIPETLAKYPQTKNYVIYHNELKTSEKFAAWLKILSGGIDHIFGSRSAIFAPCPNLKKIIIYDEHDGAYKDERSPYYDTLTIVEKLNQLTGAEIKIIDSAPKITTYYSHKSNVILGSETTPESNKADSGQARMTKRPGPKVRIVSMLDEKAAGNRLPISDLLSSYLKAATIRKKSVLLFLNKKVESGHVYCRSCKHSEFTKKQPATCSNCKSADIWFNSLNITSLATLVGKIIPDARVDLIYRADSSLITHHSSLIDIATATIFYKLTPTKYDLVAHIATDTTLNISDITSSEKVFVQITNLKRLTRGLLLLQTYNPDHIAIKTAATGDYYTFYKNQLAEREALAYPPFSLLVKLSLKGKKEENVEQNAQNLYEKLSDLPLTINHKPLTILGPFKPLFQKTPQYNIIFKIPVESYTLSSREKALGTIAPYFSKIPSKWQIVIEPDTIL